MILTKSYELFKRYGIRSVTMDEIAVQCGVSKKTVYQAFADKDSLVDAIMHEHIQFAETSCNRAQAESENAIHEVFLSMDWVHQLFDGVNPSLLFDLRKYHSSIFQKLEQHKKHFLYENFRQNFLRGMEEGLYRPDLNLEILLPLRMHSLTLVFEFDLFPTHKYTLFEIDKEITIHDLYGVATLEGIKKIEYYQQQRQKNK